MLKIAAVFNEKYPDIGKIQIHAPDAATAASPRIIQR